jgi:RNA polymerase sigma-70 factor (ECF subfamily)
MLNFRDDPTAFRAFITEHQDKVFNLVLNKVQQAEDAEEITQDVFIDVFRKPEAFRGESSVSTWLYRIAVNKCIDHLRRQKSRGRWKLTRLFSPAGETTEPKEFLHPGILSENREKAAFLFKAMKQLPDKQHTAWVLNEMENMSYKDISEVMNLSLSSVESLLFRARQNLKKILSGMYPGDK